MDYGDNLMSGVPPPSHHPQKNPNFKNLEDVSTTAYITNFPTSMGSKDLWKLCEKHGTVADVYIARKLSKIGRRFAFVRFLKVQNPESLIVSLNKVWIGSYHLFAAMARFNRKPNGTHIPSQKNPKTHQNSNPKPSNFSSNANPNRSYASALNGNVSENPKSNDRTILKSVTLDVSDLLDMSDMRNVILAKVRDVHLILNINNVLKKEGFYGFQCKYIGGMWLWIEFESPEACQKLQSNKEMSWYFTLTKHVTQTFKTDERMVWIEIGGLPLNAWTTKAYKKIAGIWGEPLFVDEDPHDNVAMGRVCIKTKIQGHIIETCKVMIHGKAHSVWVKEFAGWVPDIKDLEESSCNNSEAGNSDNHDQEVNDCGFHEVEEGELHKPSGSQEDEVVKNTQWSDDAEHNEKDQVDSPIILESHKQQTKQTSEKHKEDSGSMSKPPGFESFIYKNSHYSKQASKTSFVAAQTSRVSKPHSKSINSHGSMIDAFISHIEMGNILGYDMEDKCKAIAKLCNNHKVAFLGIQETHTIKIEPFKVKSLWGNFHFDFAVSPSSGRSGGLVSIWDPDVFYKLNISVTENLLITEGIWKSSHTHCYMINVYAPQDDRKKETLWHNILNHMERNQGHYFIFGDFNVVRNASERIGTAFHSSSANAFNQFILDGHLWDFPLGGHLFTRINNRGDKLSKLDRFLITENTTSLLHNYHAQVIECHISDHRPILLSPSTMDFGPTPFKFYNS
ncbi:RNA-directed DNA polymerase, eukaryota [Tanacetum coccineum]